MAYKEKPTLNMQFAGDVDNSIIVSFPNVKSEPVESDIKVAAAIFDNKLTDDSTAVFDFGFYNSDSIVANAD